MTIEEVIDQALSQMNVPVVGLKYSGNEITYVVYSEYHQEPVSTGDDKSGTRYYIQFDLWTKDPSIFKPKSRELKKLLLQYGFARRGSRELYYEDTGDYQKALRFSIYLDEE
jgi:hypothetical protein